MFEHMKSKIGQGLPEYALLFALIAIFLIIVLSYLGQNIGDTFSNIMIDI